jgi:hypothetical protein
VAAQGCTGLDYAHQQGDEMSIEVIKAIGEFIVQPICWLVGAGIAAWYLIKIIK